MKAGPVTKIRYRRVCEKPVDLLLNLGTRSKGTIYTCAEEPMEPCRMVECSISLVAQITAHRAQSSKVSPPTAPRGVPGVPRVGGGHPRGPLVGAERHSRWTDSA